MRGRVERFSKRHPQAAYNIELRKQKARKILAVFDDYYSGNLNDLSLLDIGCSVGVISKMLSERFARVAGIDLDWEAVRYAQENYSAENLQFKIGDATSLDFPDASFDTVVCSHIYEHVPDPRQLLSEIYRVLRPEGACYFAAGNRLRLIEPHYKLLLLSVMPRPFAHFYLRIFRKGDNYYENHLTLSGLKKLVSQFEIADYTLEIIKSPRRYYATEMLKDNSFKQRIAKWIAERAYWLCPTYIWVLCKRP